MYKLLALSTLCGGAVARFPFHSGPPSNGHDQLSIATTSGHVHGKIDPNLPNVRQFLGIPYAVPPVGALRWTAPQLLNQPEAQIQADDYGPSCTQFLNSDTASVYITDVLQFNLQGLNRTGTISEDCLALSVWAPYEKPAARHHWGPAIKTSGLPVLIFIYGGAFQTGGVDVPYQIPSQWVNRTTDHIVVSFNYRLNIFGFPNAAGLGEQNFGLLDQRAAVEWCKQNIAAFGGDPERMVLWGQSAGSISVDYYTYAHHQDPIVTGLIMDSGTAFTPFSVSAKDHSNFTFVAERVGCNASTDDPAAQLNCMRGVSAERIEDFVANYTISGESPALSFHPIADDQVVFSNYTERALAGQQAKIPAIVGTNAQDGVPFVPYTVSGVNQTLVTLALLTDFFCPATNTIRLRQATGFQSHRYIYSGNFSNISPRGFEGAYHSSELPMLMGTYDDFRGAGPPLEAATSQAFQDAYVAFAQDPASGLQGQDWPVYDVLGSREVRNFGNRVAVQDISIGGLEAMCDGAVPRASA